MAMFLDEVDLIGKPIPLAFVVGADVAIPLTFQTTAGPIDVSLRTYTCTIFSWIDDIETEIVAFNPDMTDAATGKVVLNNTLTTSGVAPGTYRWKVWETSSNTLLWKGLVVVEHPNV